MTSRSFVTAGPDVPLLSSPTSHAVVVGDTCYISGQLSLDPNGRYLAGTLPEEAALAFANFLSVVLAAGFDAADVVFVDIACVDLAHVASINQLCARLFPEGRRPARTIYQTAALPFGAQVKVMGVAMKDGAAAAHGRD